MEAEIQRILKPGLEYDHLFPKAHFTELTVKRNALVDDTVKFIPMVVSKTRWQVKRFVEQELKNLPLKSACEKLWQFVKEHIGYKKDDTGKEQVRSPRRLWWERIGDCDCYTVFIDACLSFLKGFKAIVNRITKYSKPNFQHIYPVVVTVDGQEIIMDCVVDRFNYEEPYTEKKDFIMELTYLDGVPNKGTDSSPFDEGGELGKLLDFLKKKTDPTTGEKKPGILKQVGQKIQTAAKKVETVAKKALNVVNKVNPATVLLRAGVLAAMKLNFMKVAQRLKYAYLSDTEAKNRGMDLVKFQKLKGIKDKLEKIFYGAGGTTSNFKEAILTGKGNEKREVPLSGFYSDDAIMGMDFQTPLTRVIGQEAYYNEFMQGNEEVEGLGSLGEPATAAAIAAASGVMATIATLLKNLGNLFPEKSKEAVDFTEVSDVNVEVEKVNASATTTDLDKLTQDIEKVQVDTRSSIVEETSEEPVANKSTKSTSITDKNSIEKNEEKTPTENSWWERNKKWLKPTLWGAGILAAAGTTYAFLKPVKKKEKPLDGIQSRVKRKYRKSGLKKIKTIELK